MKWTSIVAGVAVIVGLFVWHNNGSQRIHGSNVGSNPFETIRKCAALFSGDSNVAKETQDHLVNGGFREVSLDSMHKIVGNQLVIAITNTVINGKDTTITIFYGNPPLENVLEHEVANAFSWRHRIALIGSDTGKFQTSAFYKKCVSYCPRCTGAY